jgi:hypothetical protein
MDVTKPYEFIGFGAMEVTKPYEFIGFGITHVAVPRPGQRAPKRCLPNCKSTIFPGFVKATTLR